MRLSHLAVASLGHLLFFARIPCAVVATAAADNPPKALWVQPSGNSFGIDGTWSSFAFGVGAPMQHVELTVSTALSEIWVIESTGCSPTVLCTTARGGVFNISASSSWYPLGMWELGTKDLGGGGNGDYGLETLAFTNTLKSRTTSVNSALIAAINDTDYYEGFVGLGATQGRFGKNVTNPLISQLAETYGTIPSHSYGYTAGAHYRNVPASLTLGGYDNYRMQSHDVLFRLNQNTAIPSVYLRAITATVPSADLAPSRWNASTARALSSINESVTAVIDTTTPYLWLPRAVCDRFAEALDLTWNETLGVYVFDPTGPQFADYAKPDSPLSLTFSISSYDNVDDYDPPLQLPGVVNITVGSAAFAQLLRYPFKNVIAWGDSSIPYFPLTRAPDGGPYILGRAFMQEAYMVVNYDKSQFAVYPARYPDNPLTNYSLTTLERPPDSPFPAYAKPKGKSLSTAETAGIIVTAFIIGSVLGLALWYCRRRCRAVKKQAEQGPSGGGDDDKDESEAADSELPKSPVKRMMSIIIGRRRSRRPAPHEIHGGGGGGSSAQPVEVGADATHELYEMPVPPEPVELDGTNHLGDDDDDDDVTGFGTGGSQGLSAYEIARRKLERQLQGPVPTYTPSPAVALAASHPAEKSAQDPSPVPHYRPPSEPSPASSPTYCNTNSLPNSLPSPASPHPADGTARHYYDLPSPMTMGPSLRSGSHSDPSHTYTYSTQPPPSAHSPTYPPSSLSRSNSSNVSPVSPVGTMGPPPTPAFQRTPIDPSRIVCLGPLPENVPIPRHRPSIPQLLRSEGPIPPADSPPVATTTTAASQPAATPTTTTTPLHSIPDDIPRGPAHRRRSTETLGSDYTVEEENRIREEVTRQQSQRLGADSSSSSSSGAAHQPHPYPPQSLGRIDTGIDLVHVPQLAEKRYSWEEDDDR